MRLRDRPRARVDSERLLLLKGLLLWALIGSAFRAAWHYGLLPQVWSEDSTGLSVGITLIFVAVAMHGSWHVLRLARALSQIAEVRAALTQGHHGSGRSDTLPAGCISSYIQSLQTQARIGEPRTLLERSLLLEALEADLRRGQELDRLVADLLLSLGLLGTVLGFIVILGPISRLDGLDPGAIRAALAALSGGMTVALYTTLISLLGGLVLKLQCLLLDRAVQELLQRTTELTEVHILPTTQRRRSDAMA